MDFKREGENAETEDLYQDAWQEGHEDVTAVQAGHANLKSHLQQKDLLYI